MCTCTRATKRMISAHFIWLHMAKDVSGWCGECVGCALSKVTRNMHAPLKNIQILARHFSQGHVDPVGTLPVSKKGFTHLFTIMDRSTRWTAAVTLSHTTTADCAATLFNGMVACFGVSEQLTSEHGVQFTSAMLSPLCNKLDIHTARLHNHLPSTGQ